MKWIQAQRRHLKVLSNQNLKRLNNLLQHKMPLRFLINQMQSPVSISLLHNSDVSLMQTNRKQNLNMKKRSKCNSFVIRNRPKTRHLSLLKLLQRHHQKFHLRLRQRNHHKLPQRRRQKCHQKLHHKLHLRLRQRNHHKLLQRRHQSKKLKRILQRYQFLKRNRKLHKNQFNL